MADSVSGWGSYRQCDTERDHFPLESWRFLQIISYCLLIPVLSMTCLSSGPVCNQIQPAAEVALWVLWSEGLVLVACLVGEVVYQHEALRCSQAHSLLARTLTSRSLPQSPSHHGALKSHCFGVFWVCADTITGWCYLVNTESKKQVTSLFELHC